ncbi:MAG: glycosyltransferase family 2 protein [Chloroflexi bacterium]|nr:glycosyltransferase family 2 protein [Chloroflexota bacterium]MCI0579625.1 glycosyltransferase family 2 protein [Chloroflexota bacterium]MCI0643570.1 glycosyltransferase family 2 protein [Chloroflexota bacterium]MCI0726192.1 glycosyltransferase family 2 protein [Chloroflexota bacterium]
MKHSRRPFLATAFNLLAWPIAAILLLFTARRWWLTVAALLPGRSPRSAASSDAATVASEDAPSSAVAYSFRDSDKSLGGSVASEDAPSSAQAWPAVLLLAPVRNERRELPEFLAALDNLEYPAGRLTIVLIDDGSTDGSQTLLCTWANGRAHVNALALPGNQGKASALNQALVVFPQGEIVVVYDADERPRPDTLRCLVPHFADERVAAVTGRRLVSNPLDSPAATYATFENLVHQLVTIRAKDRLKLVPAILGSNCAYRREALERAGNFKPAALLEDTDLTMRLARAGWQTRFEPRAISSHAVPRTVGGYWRQHTRWARGFNEVAAEQAPPTLLDSRPPPLLRLELLLFSLGYLDRVALLLGGVLALLAPQRGLLRPALLLHLLTPLVQVLVALRLAGAPPALWLRLGWLPLFFLLDLAMAVAGLLNTWRRPRPAWEERQTHS